MSINLFASLFLYNWILKGVELISKETEVVTGNVVVKILVDLVEVVEVVVLCEVASEWNDVVDDFIFEVETSSILIDVVDELIVDDKIIWGVIDVFNAAVDEYNDDDDDDDDTLDDLVSLDDLGGWSGVGLSEVAIVVDVRCSSIAEFVEKGDEDSMEGFLAAVVVSDVVVDSFENDNNGVEVDVDMSVSHSLITTP